MPLAISQDGGRSFREGQNAVPASVQQSAPERAAPGHGRQLFAADFQDLQGRAPVEVKERGSFVASSEDEGKNWRFKKLPGALPHENPKNLGGATTLGYSAARQSPSGMIHLITTMNQPCLHFEFNEAWILSGKRQIRTQATWNGCVSHATGVASISSVAVKYPTGPCARPGAAGWQMTAGYLLNGEERWFFQTG